MFQQEVKHIPEKIRKRKIISLHLWFVKGKKTNKIIHNNAKKAIKSSRRKQETELLRI